MAKPVLLDLYCGIGGAAKGYHDSGFREIYGVDTVGQPYYPYRFQAWDALEAIMDCVRNDFKVDGKPVTLIHASPPNDEAQIKATRELLRQIGIPWVMEGLRESEVRLDIQLCGTMFDLRNGSSELRRHRRFEFWDADFVSWVRDQVPPCDHRGEAITVSGNGGNVYRTVEEWQMVMGIDWARSRKGLAAATPPAYTEWIGGWVLAFLNGGKQGKLEDAA